MESTRTPTGGVKGNPEAILSVVLSEYRGFILHVETMLSEWRRS
jgi:hypothetical protein